MKLWQFLLLLGGLCVLGAVAVLTFNFVVLPWVVHRNQVIQMPDLERLTMDEAAAKVASLRLRIETERSEASPDIPAGRILKQSPEPLASIRRGRVVRVVTSSLLSSSQSTSKRGSSAADHTSFTSPVSNSRTTHGPCCSRGGRVPGHWAVTRARSPFGEHRNPVTPTKRRGS